MSDSNTGRSNRELSTKMLLNNEDRTNQDERQTRSGHDVNINQGSNHDWYCGVSTIRRLFGLFAFFDALLVFVMWFIYTKLLEAGRIHEPFEQQIVRFNFKTSLFDFVLLAGGRFILLFMAYIVCKCDHWLMVAFTTLGTSVYLVVKIFFYDFTAVTTSTTHPMDYLIFVISFLNCWIETWIFDFKVLPKEKRHRQLHLRNAVRQIVPNTNTPSNSNNETQPLLWSDNRVTIYSEPFYSPKGSPTNSERGLAAEDHITHSLDEKVITGADHVINSDCRHSFVSIDQQESDKEEDTIPRGSPVSSRFYSLPGSRASSPVPDDKFSEHMELVKDLSITVNDLLSIDTDWKVEKTTDNLVVDSRNVQGIGKVFRARIALDCKPADLFQVICLDCEHQSDWDSTVVQNKILKKLDDQTDILYAIVAESGNGLVSKRDFLSIRHWEIENGYYRTYSTSIKDDDLMPTHRSYVRGENKLSAWIIRPLQNNANASHYTWLLHTDPKGWLPKNVVDFAIASVMIDFIKNLRRRIATVK